MQLPTKYWKSYRLLGTPATRRCVIQLFPLHQGMKLIMLEINNTTRVTGAVEATEEVEVKGEVVRQTVAGNQRSAGLVRVVNISYVIVLNDIVKLVDNEGMIPGPTVVLTINYD